MTAHLYGQVLLPSAEVSFEEIAICLEHLGWTLEDQFSDHPPLIQGEPEVASWTYHGGKPFIIYTFNPIARLRVLDVATAPPAVRMAIAERIPLIDEVKLSKLFDSPDPKDRLRALWAAKEVERVDLLARVNKLKQDPEPAIAEQAGEVAAQLEHMDAARTNMLVNLKILAEAAPSMIMRMNDPEFVRELKPSEQDLAKLFDEQLLAPASNAVSQIYQKTPTLSPIEPGCEIDVVAAPAGLLRWPNMLSNKFPLGYRDMAGWMTPHYIWLIWTVTSAGGDKVRYDGLVWLEDKWLWLPKIFRFVAPYLMSPLMYATGSH